MNRAFAAVLAGAALMLAATTFGAGAFAAPAEPDIRTLAAGAASPPAKIEAVAMIAGDWTGKDAVVGFSAPQVGEMVGHLFVTQNGASGLHELWTIKAKGDSLVLMQAFFNPDLTPRNDAKFTERPLVALGPGGKFYFNGMTLTATKATLSISVQAGARSLTFDFTRAK